MADQPGQQRNPDQPPAEGHELPPVPRLQAPPQPPPPRRRGRTAVIIALLATFIIVLFIVAMGR